MKRFLTSLLCILMVVALMPTSDFFVEKNTAYAGEETQNPALDYLCFTANTPTSTIQLTGFGFTKPNLLYSTNSNANSTTTNITWTPYVIGTTITMSNINDVVYFKASDTNLEFSFPGASFSFKMSGSIAASGNIMSLLDSSCESKSIPNEGCFTELFKDCKSLTAAPELPAKILADNCYDQMFCGCTSLTQAPELPATTLKYGCYSTMFEGCTSLTQAPELPAETLQEQCYYRMFYNCTSLTQAPELPAKALANTCYGSMFTGCTSLTQVPALLATTLSNYCYKQMFQGCISLTQVPALPATILKYGCYYFMFKDCSKLAVLTGTDGDYTWDIPNSDKNDAIMNMVTNTASGGATVELAKKYKVVPAPASITKGETPTTTYYATVKSAINAATTGDKITLLSDVTENIEIASGTNITLDLNGHVLNNKSDNLDYSTIVNKGTLTIMDSESTKEHKYVVGTDGLWTWKDDATGTTTNLEDLTDCPDDGDVIIVKGGSVTGHGIYNAEGAELTIEGGNIIGNANNGYGGIHNYKGTLNVINGKILGNKSPNSGGGIINNQGAATLGTNSDIGSVLIAYNIGTNGAGGILNYARDNATNLTINKTCTISYNTASQTSYNGNAGGVENYAENATDSTKAANIIMNNGEISHNVAMLSGGGVHNGINCIFTMNGGKIDHNKAVSRDAQDNGGNGGGISNYGTFTISGGTVTSNQGNLGGGIYNSASGYLTISGNASITQNEAVISTNGPQKHALIGGVYNDNGIVVMSGGSITNNSAYMVGGLFNEGGQFVMSGGSITGNTASTSIGGVAQFGVMHLGGNAVIKNNTEGTTTVSNLFVADLSSQTNCAPVVLGTGSDVMLANGEQVTVSSPTNIDVGVTFVEITDLTAMTFNKSTGKFTSTATADYSSKFFADDSVNYEVRSYKNGETYLARVASNAPACQIVSDGKYKDNKYDTVAEALTDVGATEATIKLLRNVKENITIASGTKITLDLNSHVLSGTGSGSVVTINSGATATITDLALSKITYYFTDEKCAHGNTVGGACTTCSSLAVKDGCFETYSTVKPSGTEGVDYIAVSGGVITGGTGSGSDGKTWGGAINNQGTLTIEEGNIVGNSALFGGGIVLRPNSELIMNGGIIAGNASTQDGAGIFIRPNSSFTMNEGSTIKYNTAAEGAGGVYVASMFTMNGGEISYNKAGSPGGGVYVSQKDQAATKNSTTTIGFEMKGGKITSNSANRRGGGVCIDYYDLGMKMTGGEISNNTVTADPSKDANDAGGGGIWVGKSLTLGGSAVVKNNTLVDKNSNTVTNNVHMPLDKYKGNTIKPSITFGTGAEALATDSSIGISSDAVPTPGNYVEFTSSANTDYVDYLSSDNDAYGIVVGTGKLLWKAYTINVAETTNGEAFVADRFAAAGTSVTVTVSPESGYQFDKITVVDKDGNSVSVNGNTFTMPTDETKLPVTVTASFKQPSNNYAYYSATQKPSVVNDNGSLYKLSYDGTKLTVIVQEGYELVEVKVNGVSKGAVTELTGLKTGDKVEVVTKKKEDAKEETKVATTEHIKAVAEQIKARSNSQYVTKNGKKAIQVKSNILEGNEELQKLVAEGCRVEYVFYRSTKKASGYKKMFVSKSGTYTNTKGKVGQRYYYKSIVRIYDINGELVAKTTLKDCKYATRIFK